MQKIKICPVCGTVFGYPYSESYCTNKCNGCENIITEIDVDTNEWMQILYPKGKNYNYPAHEIRANIKSINKLNSEIFDKYIKPLGQLDESLDIYKLNMEKYGHPTEDVGEIHRKIREQALWELNEAKIKAEQANKPQCPTCHSYNVRPISSLNRAGSVFAWGLFSSKLGKTYECLNCKYKW